MVRKAKGIVILAVAGVLWGGAALAAEAPLLTLPQLIDLALKYSPEIRASKSEVDYARARKDEAHGYLFPQIDATAIGSVVPNSRRPYLKEVSPGTTVWFFPDAADQLHGVNVFGRLDATITQPLYTFGKIKFRERAAESYVKVKEAGVEGKRGEIIARMAEAYYGLILANQGKDEVKEAKAYIRDIKDRIQRLMRVGSATVKETDRYRVNAYEGGVEKFAAEAEEGAKLAYQALKAMVGYGPGQDFRVAMDLPAAEPLKQDLDYYVRQALELRPEFTQLKEGLRARQLLVDAARADRYPSFFVAVMAALAGAPGRDRITGNYRDPAIVDYFNTAFVAPFVGMKWHWDFGIAQAKIRAAQAELDQLKHTEQAALMGIPLEVAKHYAKVQETAKGAKGLETAYVNSRRWLVTAFSNFDLGLGQLSDIFQAIERYGKFRGDYLATLYDYSVAKAKLEQATGMYRLARVEPDKQGGDKRPGQKN
jgi:outer membrane protein TolC